MILPCQNKNILFNTLTGECFIVNEDEKREIEEENVNLTNKELYQDFLEKKVIVEDDFDELKIFEYFHNKSKFNYNCLIYTVLLTWACNLKCVYCYEGAGENRHFSMNKEIADRVIKFMERDAEDKRPKFISIMLFGGEPLVNFPIGKYILEEMSTFCKEHNIILVSAIVTNGTLITDDIIKTLIENNCKYVQITLDGPPEIHNQRRVAKNGKETFDVIIDNLIKLRSYKNQLPVVIRVNVDKNNIREIPALMKILREKGLTDFNIDFGIVHGGTESCTSYESNCYVEDEVGNLLENLWKEAAKVGFNSKVKLMRKWTYCGLNCDNNYTISPEGEVYKCWEHAGEPEHLMGTIDEKGEIENQTYKFYEWMTRNPLDAKECRECVYLPACGGGCGAISYNETNSYTGKGCFKIKGCIEKQVINYVCEILKKDIK